MATTLTEIFPSSLSTITASILQEEIEKVAKSPQSSKNGSMHSNNEDSETSTLKYDQESFELFKPRVEQLCELLWPPQKSFRQTFAKSRIATRMRANKILNLLVPSQEAPLIERLRGGDYNRIVAITLPLSEKESSHRDLILRVPRWNQGDIKRMVATMSYLSNNSPIPVARIVAKDFSNQNPLKSPYVIQDRLLGCDLELLWNDLSHSQQCAIAGEVGRVIRSLLELESTVTGHIDVSCGGIRTTELHIVAPFDLKSADGDLYEELEPQIPPTGAAPRDSQTTLEFFTSQIGRWRAVDVARDAPMVDRTVDLWDSMRKVIKEMDDLGLFTTKLHCLCHVDLHPRNIMTKTQHDGSIQVTGILDWDEAVVAPKFVNCEPPGWLWGFDPNDLPHEDLPTWPYEIPGASEMPSTSEKRELKHIFEENAGREFLNLAYDEKYRMSRGLFRIALFGLTSSENYSAAERIINDWAKFRQSLAHSML